MAGACNAFTTTRARFALPASTSNHSGHTCTKQRQGDQRGLVVKMGFHVLSDSGNFQPPQTIASLQSFDSSVPFLEHCSH